MFYMSILLLNWKFNFHFRFPLAREQALVCHRDVVTQSVSSSLQLFFITEFRRDQDNQSL